MADVIQMQPGERWIFSSAEWDRDAQAGTLTSRVDPLRHGRPYKVEFPAAPVESLRRATTLIQPTPIAPWYYDQRERLRADVPVLRQLMRTLNDAGNFSAFQWGQWLSVVRGFQPDLVIELGRGLGNSTALFCHAAQTQPLRIVSLCREPHWRTHTAPALRSLVSDQWFASLDARECDILTTDYTAITTGAQRILVAWDAHGFDIAEIVLGRILPLITKKDHLVLMHDISDRRYAAGVDPYTGPIWRGSEWQERTGHWGSRINIGWMNSLQDQVVAIADFAARNRLEIGSADHEYVNFFALSRSEAMAGCEEFFSTQGHWAFLTMNNHPQPWYFPPVTLNR